jgi:transposase-like protein
MKKAEQVQQVRQWKESGLTQNVYCQKIGVKRSTFANWVKRSKERSEPGFIALTPAMKPVSETIELTYPNGVRLKVEVSNLQVLSELIRIY